MSTELDPIETNKYLTVTCKADVEYQISLCTIHVPFVFSTFAQISCQKDMAPRSGTLTEGDPRTFGSLFDFQQHERKWTDLL
jgi:hypothetical protein